MLPYTTFDKIRFKSDQEAQAAGELYKIRYQGRTMTVTDPDGKETAMPMNFEPRFGLDVSDHARLFNFIDADMERRATGK